MSTGTFQVDFEHLIRLLAENLYSDPHVAIRELIQNASDSCVRRLAQHGVFQPAIHVRIDPTKRLLVVEDNGTGMARDDVVRYLATIGASQTRQVKFSTADQNAAQMLIGQFGIGFLSTFVIGHQVTVDTLAEGSEQAVLWRSQGSADYSLELGTRQQIGTTVTIELEPAFYNLLDETTLRATIIRYADFIQFPVYLGDDARPINRMHAPWHLDASEHEYIDYVKHRYGVVPLAVEPITIKQQQAECVGVLAIMPLQANLAIRPRSLDVFQRRMYVCQDLQLLPDWATFICGIIDAPLLELVASREGFMIERPNYRALREALVEAVRSFLIRLAQREPATFVQVVKQYNSGIKQAAVNDSQFFAAVADLLTFESDIGPITLTRYLERIPVRGADERTIFYVLNDLPPSAQQRAIVGARGVPVLHINSIEEKFLKKYCSLRHGVSFQPLTAGIAELIEAETDQQWRKLEQHCEQLGMQVYAVRFEPSHLTALAMRSSDYKREQVVDSLLKGSGSLLSFVQSVGRNRSDDYVLCVNTLNPLIQQLRDGQLSDPTWATVVRALWGYALLSSGVELTPELGEAVQKAQTSLLELALAQR
ncbi:ATP-binding protein [Herpetosiphon gulosus]|uniref:Chaperone protein HtpG n=1 Tax=Herpetosiphon gulosus TaxID=1973496 RepID=A0ABP9X5C7_9CHLR